MPEIIILAGPNGAGKTSFANQFLRDEEGIAFVNADEIARTLADRNRPHREREIHAARLMLRQIDALAAGSHDFMCETTLSSLGYARKIPSWRTQAIMWAWSIFACPASTHPLPVLRNGSPTAGTASLKILSADVSSAASRGSRTTNR